jgi:hypothetical protein
MSFMDAKVTIATDNRPTFPVIQWVNGNVALKNQGGIGYTGGFFLPEDSGFTLPGGELHTLVTSDGREIEGTAKQSLNLACVRIRRCWIVSTANGTRKFPINDYDGAAAHGYARTLTHLLVDIKGIDSLCIITMRGYVSKTLSGRDGLIRQFVDKVVNEASRVARGNGVSKQFPICAFEMPLGSKTTEGKPVFTEVGSKNKAKVTLPSMILPEAVDAAALDKMYVGAARFEKLQAAYEESSDWYNAWSPKSLKGEEEEAQASAASNVSFVSGRMADDEIPF